MLKQFIALLTLISFSTAKAQTFVYKNALFFNGESVVFTKDYKPHFLLDNITGRFTPSTLELDSAEVIFKNRYNFDLQGSKELYVEPVKNVTKEYKNYRRQYIGWFNNEGQKVIFIQMLNFKNKKLAKKRFEGWEKEFEVGQGGWYESNRFIFEVNLVTKKLSK